MQTRGFKKVLVGVWMDIPIEESRFFCINSPMASVKIEDEEMTDAMTDSAGDQPVEMEEGARERAEGLPRAL